MYYIYILKCSDNSFYTGITKDLKKREKQHNWELKWWAKYTRWRRPVEIIYFEKVENKSLASKREIEIKKMTKKQKLYLINKNMNYKDLDFKNREEYCKKSKYMWKNNCPFCSEKVYSLNKILFETDFWLVIYNKYPYFKAEKNLLVFPKKHREFSWQLNKKELWDLKEVEKKLKDFYKWYNYFSFLRQTRWNKSVEHLHYHYLIWTPSYQIIDWKDYLEIKNRKLW